MWAQILNIILGLWLMASPGIFGYNGTPADNDHIVGPIVATFAIIALSGCTRVVAKYNIPFGVWLLLAPWVLGYENEVTIYNDMIAGALIALFSFSMRKTSNQYGGGWTAIWKSNTPHELEALNQ